MIYLTDVVSAFINTMGEYCPEDSDSEEDLYPGDAMQYTTEQTDWAALRSCRTFIRVCQATDPDCFNEIACVTIGELFYHARNSSGIGFFDCDAIESPSRRDLLQSVARGFGECSLHWNGEELEGFEI